MGTVDLVIQTVVWLLGLYGLVTGVCLILFAIVMRKKDS